MGMIYISSTTPQKDEKSKVKAKKRAHSPGRVGKSFESSLHTTIEFQIQGTIEDLLSDLEENEKRFLDKQSLYELNSYRAIVQKILKMVMDEGFSTHVLKRSRSGKADFVIIEKINEKLDEITRRVSSSSAFSLLKSIEEIRGLILDLLY